MMMRALQRKILFIVFVLGSFVFQGSGQYQVFDPRSSGGSGVKTALQSSYLPEILKKESVFVEVPKERNELIPLTSGGGGISSNFYLSAFIKNPVAFQTENEKIETESQFYKFLSSVTDGTPNEIRGVFSEDVLALPVVQQPSGQAGFVAGTEGVVTQFSMPNQYGVTGLLAHNYLSGRHFFTFEYGDVIQVIYGDGSYREYEVVEIQEYEALQPNSPSSKFIDLNSGENISAKQLFEKVYMGDHHLTLQTCIQEGSIDTWGRLFILATPI